ncbi:hypothetical protein ACR79B_20725 [Sphingobacterium spiritivorum]|uniref:hypothetical protein n=1 Tax=Sphingobacterium spiritivorum TaxID=258 RepID=UPI003DA585B5
MEKDKWRHTRKIAFYSAINNFLDPKTLPKRENDFIRLDENVTAKSASIELKEQLLREYKDYLNKKK